MSEGADIRSPNFWANPDFYKQRVTAKQWKSMLLSGQDTLIARGMLRQLKAKNMGAGVYEISCEPLKD